MKVSLNWIRDLNARYQTSADPAPDGVDKLVEKIGTQLGAVEEVIDLGKKYEGIVVAKVISCEKHPNADKLSVCMIDSGKGKPVQVVCGAPNVKDGQLVAWIPPGVAVPTTFDKDPLVLEAREVRGVVSNGMIASLKELALGDNHKGILVIDEDVKPGTPFAKVYGLDDYIIDIENKMFTHRPDLFGQLGIARELAGIQRHVFKSPSWYRHDAKVQASNSRGTHPLKIKNEVPKLVPRFTATVVKDVTVKPSPIWLQTYLSRVGVRPINNIVDLTNYIMLETAQPLHAYDYDKVRTGTLGVRLRKKGEELKLLGGKTIKLDDGSVVITDGRKPIGLGGVMGGADTEVDENTKAIILECANFDMNLTRHAAMTYGLFTDAATRFTKGQSPLQNGAVAAKAVDELMQIAGGRVVGSMHDDNRVPADVLKRGSVHPPVKVSADFINLRLGLELSEREITKLLQNVEFEVEKQAEDLIVKTPFWRTDIEIPEDLVEEVGRLYGYDHLPLELPKRDLTPASKDPLLAFKKQVRDILALAGGNEVLTYSFVHDSLLEKAGQDKKLAFHIKNAISPDLRCYRLSLTPSLLEKIHPNIKLGFDQFALFELGIAHVKGVEDSEKLPAELQRLALVVASKEKPPGAPLFRAKYLADFLLNRLGIDDAVYRPLTEADDLPLEWSVAAAPFEPKRTALLKSGNKTLGLVGEPIAELKQTLKLPSHTAHFELDFNLLKDLSDIGGRYRPLNRYPSTDQDICLRVEVYLSYAELTDFINRFLEEANKKHGYNYELRPVDIFQKDKDAGHKQITWRIILSHPDRTLTTAETNRLLDELASHAKKRFAAERV